MIKEIFKEGCIMVAFGILCGYFIKEAIKSFKKEEYFLFGTALTLAIGYVTHIIKYVWFY